MIFSRKSGFSLFEFLIYLCLMAITSVLVGLAGTQFFQSNIQMCKATDTVVSLTILSLQIAHDLRQAPLAKSKWEVGTDTLAWQGKHYYAWKLQNKRMMRTQGQEVAAVADGIDAFTVHVTYAGDQVRGVRYTLSKNGVSIERYVCPFERIFACIS